MRRKAALVVLFVSILFPGAYVAGRLWEEYRANSIPIEYSYSVMGIAVVNSPDFLEGKIKLEAVENPGVYFRKTLLPYSRRENTLYLSQDSGEDWQGYFSAAPGSFLCMPDDDYLEQKSDAIREGHTFTLWLVSEEAYYELSLAVSGLPVIAISTDHKEIQEKVAYEVDPDKLYFGSEDLYYGNIQVFDPGVSGRGYAITGCNVRYHYKGASTSRYDKRSYAFSLQDIHGKNVDISLLGMRSDNSWKLNAMVTDDNRIREMTACGIWELFDMANGEVREPGPRMEYAEFILDNDYQGLYCLVEPVDEKKLQLDNNDVLYKILDHTPFQEEDVRVAMEKKWRVMLPVRIRYPKEITDYGAAWHPMLDFNNKTNYGQAGYKNVRQIVYPENVYDMFMFLMTVSGSDNEYKNMYFAADVQSGGGYRMKMIPWDLDLTFGNIYDGDNRNFTRFDPDVTCVYQPAAADLLMQYAEGSYEDILLERWRRYRQSFLSTEAIFRLMLDNQECLVYSGVAVRENARWPDYQMSNDIGYLLEYQRARMEWLDRYFESL